MKTVFFCSPRNSFTPQTLYSRDNSPVTQSVRGWGGPRADLDTFGQTNSFPCR